LAAGVHGNRVHGVHRKLQLRQLPAFAILAAREEQPLLCPDSKNHTCHARSLAPGYDKGHTLLHLRGERAMATIAESQRGRFALAGVLLAGSAVAVALGVYGHVHRARLPIFVFGFSGVIQFKVWLATIAIILVAVQVTTALWMWGRLPGAGAAPGWVAPVHRWSGTLAFITLIPVALNCLLTFGFATYSTRALVHSIAGCTFYGAYSSKMLR